MAEEEIIIIDDDMDDDDYWMDPAVAERIEMEREKRKKWKKLYAKEESSDKEPDFDFRTSDDEELLQYEREQISKKNLETSIVQFIRHRELGLKKPRTNSLKRFLKSRKYCANSLRKCDASSCIYEEDPNHTTLRCFGNRLYENLELRKKMDKFEYEHENMLRQDLETLKVKYFCRCVINLKHSQLCLISEFTRVYEWSTRG